MIPTRSSSWSYSQNSLLKNTAVEFRKCIWHFIWCLLEKKHNGAQLRLNLL